ncbi:MAG: tetratricopeptide repeat protein [Promethearchaeota archaeon]|nr:MAG: tetratricopeptide repeat protein [Candidatus Lokiarchaeota archaeon]
MTPTAYGANVIGNGYLKEKMYSEALDRFNKALEIAKNFQNPLELAIAYKNIAMLYGEQGK